MADVVEVPDIGAAGDAVEATGNSFWARSWNVDASRTAAAVASNLRLKFIVVS
jgi:hypothetical protein